MSQQPEQPATAHPIAELTLALVAKRGPAKSICPSEVARQHAAEIGAEPRDWRALMPLVRQVGFDLAKEGRLHITQRGVALDPNAPEDITGPIRFRLAT